MWQPTVCKVLSSFYPAYIAARFRVPCMEIIYCRMCVEYTRYQLIHIAIAYQLGEHHLLAAAVADEGKRKTLPVGFYFGRKPVNILVGLHFFRLYKYRTGLVI